MSGLTQHQSKKTRSQPLDLVIHLDLVFHSLGDISSQNWTLGNEYRPVGAALAETLRKRDNLRLAKAQLHPKDRLKPGSLRPETLHPGAAIDRNPALRSLADTIEIDLLTPEIWSETTQQEPVYADAGVRYFQPWTQTSPHPLLIDIFSSRERAVFMGLVSLWATTLLWFWHWWLQPQHITSIEGAIVCSILLAWNTILPAYYFFFVWRMKRPNPSLNLPSDWRVAMVVTKAPSEPWDVVKNTLKAMLAQNYRHDTWLADEQPTPATLEWCRAHQVKVSTRHGVEAYHRENWPRRTKCKEGNLAYFYDHYGYEQYDFVAQLDADHIPNPGYLTAILRPFLNDRVGYVAAPSICGANAQRSWVVNARLFAESTMHGSLQAGYSNGWAPLCIGSHYAIRTKAVQEIGGLGPELAEDHTTTLMMNSCGWRGVFALDAEAHGDGPTSFADFLVQEFQWARSLVIVLLSITPRYIGTLPPHLKFQFLFSQFWYPIFALTMLIGSLLPAVALVFDRPWMNVNYLEFLTRSVILTITCIFPVMLVKRSGSLRPHNAKIMSWETVLFQFARWPWILMAVWNATISCIQGREVPFKVTPKGESKAKPLPFPLIVPYLLLALISGLAMLLCRDVGRAQGYYLLAGLNMLIYGGLCLLVIQLHFQENVLRYRDYLHHYSATGVIFGLLSIVLSIHLEKGVKAMFVDRPILKSLFSNPAKSPPTSTSIPDAPPDHWNSDLTGNMSSQPIDRRSNGNPN